MKNTRNPKNALVSGLDFIQEIIKQRDASREKRIKEWTNPDLKLAAIKDCRGTIGLWKVVDSNDPGVIKIEANRKEEFDPYMHTFFSKELILALYRCLMGE